MNFHVSTLVGVPRCSSLMVTRTRVSNEPARSLFYNILSHRFAGIFRENIFPVRKKERRGEWKNESGEKKQGFESGISLFHLLAPPSFLPFSSFSIFFLSFVQSPSPLPTKRTPRREFLKVETFALAGAQLLKLSITGPPSPSLSISSFSPLSTRGRHRYKTAFASLSNSRSYSPFSLSLLLLIFYAIFHLPLSPRPTRTCTLARPSLSSLRKSNLHPPAVWTNN